MSQYTKSTNFATKDNLSPGDPLKIVRGTEIDTEFNNISTAISTKTDNSAANITGGSITGITDLAVADGGTGASTATAAINNLLPSQTSNANKYLQTDGTNVSWDAVSLSTADITGTLPVANGGTGSSTAAGARSNLSAAASGANSDITSLSGLTTALSVAQGGTGITSFGSGVATFLGTPSSANLLAAITDETGTGALVFANSPTLVTPALGTPASGNFSTGTFTWPTFNQNTTGTAAGLSATLAIASGGTGATTAGGALTSLGAYPASNPSGYTSNAGTVTSVGGTGTVSGISLSGTVTSSGSLTLGGTLDLSSPPAIGATTPAAGTFTTLSATSLTVARSASWTQSTDTYSGGGVSDVHTSMRRCLLRDDGTVNYYLNPTNSALKADGSSSVLTGADGQVMVEIPAFYVKFTAGSTRTWSISLFPAAGYSLHPAFIKNGVFVPYRYIGAYDACVNSTGSTYESGLNYDNNWSSGQNWSADSSPKLSSVSGVYPAVGITRANARTLAANRGTGWRQVDVYLAWAVELLFLVEYATFRTQQNIGDGNVSVSTGYLASSGNQTDSPHSVAGKSNSIGNASTNTTNGASSGTRDTAFMSYRGIENWYGNCWNWVDGYNINNNQAYVSNTNTQFADDTTTNYDAIGAAMVASNGYITNCQQEPFAFLPSAVGGSSSTYWADYYYQNSGWRVAFFGGSAGSGALAGGFYWALLYDSSFLDRDIGARLAF